MDIPRYYQTVKSFEVLKSRAETLLDVLSYCSIPTQIHAINQGRWSLLTSLESFENGTWKKDDKYYLYEFEKMLEKVEEFLIKSTRGIK